MQSFNDKTVLVTGGAGGIGLGLARAFAAEGASILLADVDRQALAAARGSLEATGARVDAEVLDVTDFGAWQDLVAQAPDRIGAIDVLCNNAGIGCDMQNVATLEPEEWRQVIAVNLTGPFLGCRAVLPQLLARGTEGHVVNIASLSGLRANPAMSAYGASKHGLVGLSDALRAELAPTRVGVTIVYPGLTRTNFITNTSKASAQEEGKLDHVLAAMQAGAMSPDKLGERVVRAVRDGEYNLMTHIGAREQIAGIFSERLDAFRENADPDYVDDVAAIRAAIEANIA